MQLMVQSNGLFLPILSYCSSWNSMYDSYLCQSLPVYTVTQYTRLDSIDKTGSVARVKMQLCKTLQLYELSMFL